MPALHSSTIGEALRRAAKLAPERCYLGFLDGKNQATELSFGELLSSAEALAKRLQAQGLKPGERVFLLLPTGLDFLEAFYGCVLAGGVPVPWPMPLTLGRIDTYLEGTVLGVIQDAGANFALTTDRADAALQSCMGETACVLTLERLRALPPSDEALPSVDPDEVALLQYTSGKAKQPGGVCLTHRQVLSNVAGVGQALKLGEDDVAVSWIPLVHDMGLVGVLFAGLYFSFPSYVMPPEAFLMRPHRWLQAIGQFKATLSAAPNFAYQLCLKRVKDSALEGVDLSSWRLALNGAEQVQPLTCEAFAERFAAVGFRRDAFYPLYGLAENALAATCPPLDHTYETTPLSRLSARAELLASSPAPEGDALVASVGTPLPGQEVGVASQDGRFLPELQEGEILVRGVCLMKGIHNNETRTRALLRDGWLHTGDLGFIAEGRLFVTGRIKHMLIKMGRNYYPQDVEAVLAQAELAEFCEGRRITALSVGNSESGTEDLWLLLEGEGLIAISEERDQRRALENGLNTALLDQIGIRADKILMRDANFLGQEPELQNSDQRRDKMRARLPELT